MNMAMQQKTDFRCCIGFLIGLFLLIAVSLPGKCQSSLNEFARTHLAGEWIIDFERQLESIKLHDGDTYNTFDPLKKKDFNEFLKTRKYRFGSAGEFSAAWQSERGNHNGNGRWEIVDGEILRIQLPFSFSDYRLRRVNDDSIVLIPLSGGRGLLNQLCLVKKSDL